MIKKKMARHTWLIAFAEHEVSVVPREHNKKVPIWNGAGAIAYPAIVVITTRPEIKQEKKVHILRIVHTTALEYIAAITVYFILLSH